MKNLTVVSLLLLLTACCTGCVQEKPVRIPEVRATAWCINVCVEDIFDDMHTRGESWGTGSSSLTGMQQTNLWEKTTQYCSSLYERECYKVYYDSPLLIHKEPRTFRGATNTITLGEKL